MASSEQAKSYLEGGVSVVGEVAEAYWGRTGTCSENGGENPQQLPGPALTSPGQRRLEDMAAVRKTVSSQRKVQKWLCAQSTPKKVPWDTQLGRFRHESPSAGGGYAQCLLGTLSEL